MTVPHAPSSSRQRLLVWGGGGHGKVVADVARAAGFTVVGDDVKVGALSWIGAGATVIQQVRVGQASIVGAGAVVIRDVPDEVTVVGCPARLVR